MKKIKGIDLPHKCKFCDCASNLLYSECYCHERDEAVDEEWCDLDCWKPLDYIECEEDYEPV